MKKETPQEPTTREIESPPDRSAVLKDNRAVFESANKVRHLVLRKEATIELKINDKGLKQVNIWHDGKIIGSTSEPAEVADLEEFKNNPEEYFRKQELKNIEEDFYTQRDRALIDQFNIGDQAEEENSPE
jgi:hypothetical protein